MIAVVLLLWYLPGLGLARALGLVSRRDPLLALAIALPLSAALTTLAAFVSAGLGLDAREIATHGQAMAWFESVADQLGATTDDRAFFE